MRIPTSIPKYLQIQRNTLGQHLPQFEQRMNLTWPRPCLLRPPFLRLKVCRNKTRGRERERLGQSGRRIKRLILEGDRSDHGCEGRETEEI